MSFLHHTSVFFIFFSLSDLLSLLVGCSSVSCPHFPQFVFKLTLLKVTVAVAHWPWCGYLSRLSLFLHKRNFLRLQWKLALVSGMSFSWLMKACVFVLHVARSGHFLDICTFGETARWDFFFLLKGNWPCEIRVLFFQLPLTFIAFLKIILKVFVHTQTQTPPPHCLCWAHFLSFVADASPPPLCP